MRPAHAGRVPTFSAFVAVYQGASFIADAIESILTQTVAPHEIIVVDDGSTDDLASVLDPYRARITLLHQEHKGQGAARNLGLYSATGDFILPCDAGDVWRPELVEAMGDLSSAYPELDILARGSHDELNGQVVHEPPGSREIFASDEGQRLAILRSYFIPSLSAFRRERALRIGGFDETMRYAEDYDCHMRMILDGARAGFVDECLYIYKRRPGISHSTSEVRKATDHVAALRKTLNRDDLSASERAQAKHSLKIYGATLARARAREALVDQRPDARRLSLHVATCRGAKPTTRLKALVAAAAPGHAARRLGVSHGI